MKQIAKRIIYVGPADFGKTELAIATAKVAGLDSSNVLSTDEGLRSISKSIVADLKDGRTPSHPLYQTIKEIALKHQGITKQEVDLTLLTETSQFQKTYGEALFREIEEKIVMFEFEKGVFDNVDTVHLGGAVYNRPLVREMLREKGYVTVFLNVDESVYSFYHAQTLAYNKLPNIPRPKNSNYTTPAIEAEARGEDPIEVMNALTRKHLAERSEGYGSTDLVFNINKVEEPEVLAKRVIEMVSQFLQAS